jgi:DNA polymerase
LRNRKGSQCVPSQVRHHSTHPPCQFLDHRVNGREEQAVGGETDTIGADVLLAEARSALAWWLEAGVDIAIAEQPRDWLAPVEQRARPAAEPAPAPNVSAPSHETLAELREWLASSAQLPLASETARRILPHGPEKADVMLLSDAPTLDDFTAGQPIGGDAWELAKRMLAAIRIAPDNAYSASLSCFHAPGTRMSAKDREDCAAIARPHIRLVKPKRLLLLGDGPAQALLGKRVIEARGHVHKVEGVRTVATFHPRHLIKRPLDKALAWQDLLLLMEDEA